MELSKKTLFRPYLALGIGVIAISFSAVLVKAADAPGPVSSFYRMLFPVVFFAIPFFRQKKSLGGLSGYGVKMAVWAGVFFGLDVAAWATGVVMSEATNPTLLSNTAPLWVGLGALVFFNEKQTLGFWGGLVIALTGAAFILGFDSLKSTSFGLGSFLGLLAGFFYGGFFLFSQKSLEKLNSLSFFWIACLSSGIVVLIFIILLGQPLLGYSLQTVLMFLGMGLIVQVFGWLVISYAQGRLPASVVSPSLLGQPVGTAILASFLLNEQITSFEILSGAAVLSGIYIIHRSRLVRSTTENGH